MEYSEYINLVREDIELIKEKATKEELAKLNAQSLNPKSCFTCIYGQLTGYHKSTRAEELKSSKTSLLVHYKLMKKDSPSCGAAALENYLLLLYCGIDANNKVLHNFFVAKPPKQILHIVEYLKGKKKRLRLLTKKEFNKQINKAQNEALA